MTTRRVFLGTLAGGLLAAVPSPKLSNRERPLGSAS